MYKNQRHFENAKQHDADIRDERLADSLSWAFISILIICILLNSI